MNITKKLFALLLAGMLVVSSMTACRGKTDGDDKNQMNDNITVADNTPPTPEAYMEVVRSDADMIIHKVVRYGTEDGEKKYEYTYERDGNLMKVTTVIIGTMTSTDGTTVRYHDFANAKVYVAPSKKWTTNPSYDSWEEYLKDDLTLIFSKLSNEEPVWKNGNYCKDGDRYVMTEEAVNAIVDQENFHDSYGENPVYSVSFEKKDGAYVFIERLQGEDESIYMENIITVTLKDVTVELPKVDE